jgi:chromate reductase
LLRVGPPRIEGGKSETGTNMYEIAVLVGSLRRDSVNRSLARGLERLAAGRLAFRYIDLDLPLYNDDLWADPPAAVLRMKQAIAPCDAVLFVTPEHNRSIPAVMKNAVDWGSRPWRQSSWTGKPAAVVGASIGQIGSAVAQSHLRSILVTQDMAVLGQPEVYFAKPGLIEADGRIDDAETSAFLGRWVDKFVGWIDRTAPARD